MAAVTWTAQTIGNSVTWRQHRLTGMGLGRSPLGRFSLGDPDPVHRISNVGTGKFWTAQTIGNSVTWTVSSI